MMHEQQWAILKSLLAEIATAIRQSAAKRAKEHRELLEQLKDIGQ